MERVLAGIIEDLELEISELRSTAEDSTVSISAAIEDVIEGIEMAITVIRRRS